MAILTLLWAKVWKWIVAAGVLLAAVAAIFLKGRAAGVKTMQAKVEAAKDEAVVAVATNQQLESRNETDAAIDAIPDAPAGPAGTPAPADSLVQRMHDDGFTRD